MEIGNTIMSCTLPEQQDTQGTYMGFPVLAWLIENKLTPKHAVAELGRVWNSILCNHFKSIDGYSTGPEVRFGTGRGHHFGAYLVIAIRDLCEEGLLIFAYTQPGTNAEGESWKIGAEQIQDHLQGLPRSRTPRFAAIGVGSMVRFYKLVDGTLVDFESNGSSYHVGQQCQEVSRVLEMINNAN